MIKIGTRGYLMPKRSRTAQVQTNINFGGGGISSLTKQKGFNSDYQLDGAWNVKETNY